MPPHGAPHPRGSEARFVAFALAWTLLAAGCAHGDPAPGRSAAGAAPSRQAAVRPAAPGVDLVWPVDGKIISRFGSPRASRTHKGLDIKVPHGTPVRAAAAGRVVYSGRMRGYGKVVIVAHGDGYETVYAHNRANRAHKGDRVRRGQVIAESGASGNATTPHLHFEVRKDQRHRDPLGYLPVSFPASPAP